LGSTGVPSSAWLTACVGRGAGWARTPSRCRRGGAWAAEWTRPALPPRRRRRRFIFARLPATSGSPDETADVRYRVGRPEWPYGPYWVLQQTGNTSRWRRKNRREVL